jgi:hypothetical protein
MTPDNATDTNKPVEKKKESEAMEWLDDDNFDHYWYAEEDYNDYS